MQGMLYIISAPSGAGKSTIIKKILAEDKTGRYKLSVSHTSRTPRVGEQEGVDYYFISKQKFEFLIKQNKFIEYANVFDNYYGTSKDMIDNSLQEGFDVFLDIDWQGARQVRKQFANQKSIFILPPSLHELRHRLEKRKQDSIEVITSRMQKAQDEISHYAEYDYVIINDEICTATKEIINIMNCCRFNMNYQWQINQTLINELLAK